MLKFWYFFARHALHGLRIRMAVPPGNAQSFNADAFVSQHIKADFEGEITGDKVRAFLLHYGRLGVAHPSDKAWQRLAGAFLCLTVGAEAAMTQTPLSLHQLLRDFKRALRSNRPPPLVEPFAQMYPPTAGELLVTH